MSLTASPSVAEGGSITYTASLTSPAQTPVTVTLSNGRLIGNVKGTEKDRPFDVTLDVAVLSDDHGAVLPADGGAPGKAYLAYHAALVKRDAQAVRRTLSPGNLEVYDGAQKKNDLDSYLSYLAGKHPMKAVKITRGWATATKASLLVEGESSAGKVAGEVFLINSQGNWGVDEELVDSRAFTAEAGEEGARRFLDLADPPTAIFAAADPLALGALRAAEARGVRVPEQLSVIGFDDTMMTRWTTPPLSAVSQPLFSLGQVAVERLLALAADPQAFAHPFQLETRLVERGSTAARPRP